MRLKSYNYSVLLILRKIVLLTIVLANLNLVFTYSFIATALFTILSVFYAIIFLATIYYKIKWKHQITHHVFNVYKPKYYTVSTIKIIVLGFCLGYFYYIHSQFHDMWYLCLIVLLYELSNVICTLLFKLHTISFLENSMVMIEELKTEIWFNHLSKIELRHNIIFCFNKSNQVTTINLSQVKNNRQFEEVFFNLVQTHQITLIKS